jgi:hypothetical protein
MMAVCEKQLLAVFGFSVDNSTIGCNCCSSCKEQNVLVNYVL